MEGPLIWSEAEFVVVQANKKDETGRAIASSWRGLGRPHRDVSMIPCSDNAMGLRCTA